MIRSAGTHDDGAFGMKTVSDARLVDLRAVIEENGTLVAAEASHLSFEVARVFAVTAVAAGERRGEHAHKQLNQLLVCLSGVIEVVVDDGEQRQTVTLDSPSRALHLPPGIWAEQTYGGPTTVLMVLCDRPYEESDYIRDYQEFLAWRRDKASESGVGG